MNKIKLIIFDLDGVIVSTDKYHYIAWKKIADKEKIEFNETINNRLRGVGRIDSLEIILENANKEYTTEDKQILANKKNEIYISLLSYLTPDDILPGVKLVMDSLRENGFKLAIGSSSKNTRPILRYTGLADYFDFISDGNNITRSKPYPDVFLYVTNNLKINPNETIVVEDAKAGIKAASLAGMIPAGIGDACNDELTQIPLKQIEDLLKYLNIGGYKDV